MAVNPEDEQGWNSNTAVKEHKSKNKNKKRPYEAEAAAADANKSPPHKYCKTSTTRDASLPNNYASAPGPSDSKGKVTDRKLSKKRKKALKKQKKKEYKRAAKEKKKADLQPFELEEINGDLFQCPREDAMAHCVSEDLAMGKGIAVMFKKKFDGVGLLKAQDKKVGEVATLLRNGKYVYYLITKRCYYHKPTLQTVRDSLISMRTHMMENKVTSLSMPTIGCGLDGLYWGTVSDIIKEVFRGTGIRITIYHYDRE